MTGREPCQPAVIIHTGRSGVTTTLAPGLGRPELGDRVPPRVRQRLGDPSSSFAEADDDPVSVAAGHSVAQLIHGFAEGGLVDPLTGTAFAGTLAMFLLGDEDAFRGEAALLEQRCREDPFETVLTAVMFCVLAMRLWGEATGRQPEAWASEVVDSGRSIPYVTQIVLAAHAGKDPEPPLPGHPEDQWKVAVNLGPVTAMTLLEIARHVPHPLISVLQDLIIRVQRTPGASTVPPSERQRPR